MVELNTGGGGWGGDESYVIASKERASKVSAFTSTSICGSAGSKKKTTFYYKFQIDQ